jgi:hypothetical protein
VADVAALHRELNAKAYPRMRPGIDKHAPGGPTMEVIDAATTRLHLRHQMLPVDQAVGYSAGWHAYLDRLEDVAAGRDPVDWEERFSSLLPGYGSRMA